MDNRKTQMYTEGRTEAPGTQPSPCLRITIKRAGVEPTTQGVSRDASEFGSGKQPSSASGGSEKGPRHREAFQVEPSDVRTWELRPPAKPGKKQSSWVPQKGSQELQAGQDQSELGLSPSWIPEAREGLQQPGSGKKIKGQQGRQRNPGIQEDQPPESCQGAGCQSTLGHQADMVQPREASCPLESRGQPLRDKHPKEAGVPHIRPQEALPELSPGGHEDSSQEAMSPVSMVALEEKAANPFLPSMPGPKKTKEGVEAVENQPAPGPLPPPEVRDIGDSRELDRAQHQLQDPVVASGKPSLRNLRRGFIKCLLEMEEVEASHRRALKARSLTAQKSPRTVTRVPTSTPSLPQTPASDPASCSSWAQLPAPGPVPALVGAPVSTSMPCTVLLGPSLDLSWRRMELLHQSSERTLSYSKAQQEPVEHSLQKPCQNWEERPEEHLNLKQEEAFRSYFEIFNGPGEVDTQSLKNILLLVGFSVTPAQVEDALMSADVNGDGHVNFKDFLAVMTDTRRFFCSVEQNALTNMAPHKPHTLLFEILSQLVEMLALPEAALEEITNYYQKKLKAGTCKAQEMKAAIRRLRLQKIPYNPQQEESSEVPERKVLSILSRLKQQNYALNLQSPYGQVPCIPLCLRLDKMVCRKPTTHHVLDQCVSPGLDPDICSPFFQSGSQGKREHNSDSRKWLSSMAA
ncbi:spermatogenesis-associated protein 21 isoform X2 [Callithrix jacchus]|uniref:spermatogenesis-associated protein 21 isoform X2 n=1 Tax=Callithrix jacchus TaxID=9483 RepID=UPI00159E2952|nr:spermatogenesis-associated protein 21 isoform X2 [Callithrix jacchus]